MAACTAGAQGTLQGIVDYSSSIVSFFDGTAGWTFRPTGAIGVSHLGAFTNIVVDQGPVVVGLWSADGTLLASANVTGGGELVNNSLYTAIEPLWLVPMQEYHLGAFSPASGRIYMSFYDALQPNNTLIVGPGIQFIGQAQNGSTAGLAFPAKVQNGEDAGWMAANFLYIIPEPSSVAILLLGGGLVLFRRRAVS